MKYRVIEIDATAEEIKASTSLGDLLINAIRNAIMPRYADEPNEGEDDDYKDN